MDPTAPAAQCSRMDDPTPFKTWTVNAAYLAAWPSAAIADQVAVVSTVEPLLSVVTLYEHQGGPAGRTLRVTAALPGGVYAGVWESSPLDVIVELQLVGALDHGGRDQALVAMGAKEVGASCGVRVRGRVRGRGRGA